MKFQINQIIELLSSISSEAVVPKEKKKSAVIKALFTELTGILSSCSTLVDVCGGKWGLDLLIDI